MIIFKSTMMFLSFLAAVGGDVDLYVGVVVAVVIVLAIIIGCVVFVFR